MSILCKFFHHLTLELLYLLWNYTVSSTSTFKAPTKNDSSPFFLSMYSWRCKNNCYLHVCVQSFTKIQWNDLHAKLHKKSMKWPTCKAPQKFNEMTYMQSFTKMQQALWANFDTCLCNCTHIICVHKFLWKADDNIGFNFVKHNDMLGLKPFTH
jgi:hypothetical protein